MSEVLTLDEAAARLKVRPATMRLYARKQIVPGVKLGKHWRFRADDLPCSISAQAKPVPTGGSDSPSRPLKSGNRVAQIARNLRKRLNRA